MYLPSINGNRAPEMAAWLEDLLLARGGRSTPTG
jgi:hypothetical protein